MLATDRSTICIHDRVADSRPFKRFLDSSKRRDVPHSVWLEKKKRKGINDNSPRDV